MRPRTILLQPAAPPKPAVGQPCNGCGLCCAAEPCPAGIVASRRLRGACSALVWHDDEGRYRCGLVAKLPLLKRWIAAGTGCDSTLEAIA